MGMGRKKIKNLLGKIKKNLLGGSLTVALPWEGEGVPLSVVSPDTRQKHTQPPFVYVMNVTQRNKTHTSHIKAPQKPIRKPENRYPYRKIYVICPYIIMKYLNTINFKRKVYIRRVYIIYINIYNIPP